MNSYLTPALALILWTLIIWVVMYVRLIPHLRNTNVDSQSTRSPEGEWRAALPDHVQYGMHNYNHLMEQPTIFYALMFYLHLAGPSEVWIVFLAWSYVGLRIAHSLVQVTKNHVMTRFTIFFLSTIALIMISVRALVALV